MNKIQNSKLIAPDGEKKVLLHTCCAVCAGGLIESIVSSGIELTIYYYNPNIFPSEEYERRKKESQRFAVKLNIPFVEGTYDNEFWYLETKGYEKEPERGKRCKICFDVRLERTAQYASENNFKVFTTTLGISRWKDFEQIVSAGNSAAKKHSGIIFWDYNWRKKGGQDKMQEVAKKEKFYRQNYCGCEYSVRDI